MKISIAKVHTPYIILYNVIGRQHMRFIAQKIFVHGEFDASEPERL